MNNPRQHRRRTQLILLVLALVLASCGGESSPEPASTTTAPAPPQATETQATETTVSRHSLNEMLGVASFELASDSDYSGDWIPIVFLRSPLCLAPVIDVIAPSAELAATCPPEGLTGSEVGDFVELTGSDVPVWFVHRTVWEAAVLDDSLQIVDLKRLPTLVQGVADSYRASWRHGALEQVMATGSSADGKTFSIEMEGASVDVLADWPDLLPPPQADSLVGRWQTSRYELQFTDGSFQAFSTGVGEPLDSGSYTLDGYLLTIETPVGSGPCTGAAGAYLTIPADDGSMEFLAIVESCFPRRRNMPGRWTLMGDGG